MKTILVATDFSHAARNAAKYAADMALAINAKLLLLHVYQIPVTYLEVPVLVNEEEIRNDAEKNILKLKEELDGRTAGKLNIETEVKMGTFFHELKETCRDTDPYAVVMGSQGTTGAEHFLFGTHAVYATKHLTWPVITVPQDAKFSSIKKIGFACDFEKVVESTPIQFIKNMVKEFGAELHVLNVDYNDRHFTAETPEQSALLHTLLEESNPVYHFISNKDVEDGINDFADDNKIDLLISIPKKHKLLESLFKPSSTKQLVYQSHVPVMCVHE